MMKLRTFAQWAGVRYEMAWRWFKAGKIKGYQLGTKTIVITEDLGQHPEREIIVVVYARVSANEHRPNLERQAERFSAYCVAKGWKVHKVVKEHSTVFKNVFKHIQKAKFEHEKSTQVALYYLSGFSF